MSTPPTANTDIMVANNALASIGASRMQAWDEDTNLVAQVSAVYSDVVESCLAAHPWTFARMTVALQRLEAVPINGWRYGYALPAEILGLPFVLHTSTRSRNPLREFSVEGKDLFADQPALWASGRGRPSVSLWPPPFRRFVTTALAAALAVPISHDAQLAATLEDQAWGSAQQNRRAGQFGQAMAADLSHPGSEPMWATDPLTEAWYGGS